MDRYYPSLRALIFLALVLVVNLTGCETGRNSNNQPSGETALPVGSSDTITVCTFNIQFLGQFTRRDNNALTDILKNYDLVIIQELVAPPMDGVYLDGEAYSADLQAAAFFEAMQNNGFEFLLSEEDTGPGETNHNYGSATEWWVAFYQPERIETAADLPSGFLADDRSQNDDFERVPYAFAFRVPDSTMDFILISVHLKPGDSSSEKDRRAHELSAITNWIEANSSAEKDFIILGDMNIEDTEELSEVTPAGFLSLNDECRSTNTLVHDDVDKGRPYDHVMFDTAFTKEVDRIYDLKIIDLVEEMRDCWVSSDPYPGDPYDHNLFKQYYSDHYPVVFRMISSEDDDD
jgi:endonuclease/exonuclease/phosphatase family metal-dependent hydrolase